MNKIITKKEQKILLDWINFNTDKFTINDHGSNRKFIRLNNLNETEKPKLISEIKNRILIKEKIFAWEQDPFFGDIITYNTEGGYIHEHKDPTLLNREHFRFNLFLSKPKSGGDPILMGEKLKFEEREYIKYHVNKDYHKSLPVKGKKPRIAISYGILITTDYLNQLNGGIA